ncbi:hypothetical protein [Fibrobacter sp.]
MAFKIFISSVQKEFAKERKWLADYGQNALKKGLPSRTNDMVNDRVILISKTNFAHATIERAVKKLKEKNAHRTSRF